jgi:hypothetical protein
MTFFHDSFESFYAAWALKRDFDNKEYDLIRKSYNNERLSETWGFFCKRLQPEDFEKVKAIVANTSENSS